VFRDAALAPELVVIPAGEFMMGSPDQNEGRRRNEGPRHRVTIGRRFALGRYPVTFDEYDRFCEATRREKPGDEGWGRGRRPVINISWDDAQAYIAWLSQETGKTYRLPSEAEWEYACRAGTTTRYSFGDAITPQNANYGDSGLGRTSEVGTYPANPWKIHDMHGNVWEWLKDDWHENYQSAPTDGSAWKDAQKGREPRLCVLRGGSWYVNRETAGLPTAAGTIPSTGTTTAGSEWPEHFLNS
jgi:formylglycine-generating enzyme required for sulfatase activity